jgi:hypothetical protein
MPPSPSDPADPTSRDVVRQRLGCPSCGASVRRRRRSLAQRWLLRGTALGRYRCTDRSCGWTGLLTRDLGAAAARPTSAPRGSNWRAPRGVVPLALAAFAVLAAQWGAGFAPVANVPVGARLFAPGEAFDGEALPEDHPLLVPALHVVEAAEPAHVSPGTPPRERAAAASVASPRPPAAGLGLRRFCAWGHPGRMPYRGTVDEALRAARLPAEVREQIVAAVAAGRPHGRLVITNDTIRSVSGERAFEPQGIAMAFGRTLCLGTRVNFKPGHSEPASLYEAFDTAGHRHSVMVPDVCGNVSVLRPQGDLPGLAKGVPMVLAGLDPLDPGAPTPMTASAGASEKPNEVPVPGTLALALVALAASAAARARARGQAPAGARDAGQAEAASRSVDAPADGTR